LADFHGTWPECGQLADDALERNRGRADEQDVGRELRPAQLDLADQRPEQVTIEFPAQPRPGDGGERPEEPAEPSTSSSMAADALNNILIFLRNVLICGGGQHIDRPLEADLHCAQRLSSNCLQQPMMTTAGNT
jgi:hypothetical protein